MKDENRRSPGDGGSSKFTFAGFIFVILKIIGFLVLAWFLLVGFLFASCFLGS